MKRRGERRPSCEALEARALLSVLVPEREPNNAPARATPIVLGADPAIQLQGRAGPRDRDFFRFTAAQSGPLNIRVGTTNGVLAKLDIENAASVEVFETQPRDGRNAGRIQVTAGATYTVRLLSPLNRPAEYLVDLVFADPAGGGGTAPPPTSVVVEDRTPNDRASTAQDVTLLAGETIQLRGRVQSGRDRDVYAITAPVAGVLTVAVTSTSGVLARAEVESGAGADLGETEPKNGVNAFSVPVLPGQTYFLKVRSSFGVGAGYAIDLTLTPGGGGGGSGGGGGGDGGGDDGGGDDDGGGGGGGDDGGGGGGVGGIGGGTSPPSDLTEDEPNDTKPAATEFTFEGDRVLLRGSIASEDDRDFFVVVPPRSGRLRVQVVSLEGELPRLGIEDASGNTLLAIVPDYGPTSGTVAVISGTPYFVRVGAGNDVATQYIVNLEMI
jgi:hypothetical protein